MSDNSYRFDRFQLDPGNRRLTLEGQPVELNARYLDALTLLVREQGQLVSKDRFLDEVWAGVPVTEEALTQCIRTLRRQLGDSASQPQFIETVPKHGYRFIAAVAGSEQHHVAPAPVPQAISPASSLPAHAWQECLRLGVAGTIGACIAGLIGGLIYGMLGASLPAQSGMGAMSILMVLMSVTFLVALLGGAGVSFGIAAAGLISVRHWPWFVIGGAFGGFVVGAFVKLLGVDVFQLLFGQSPGDITGGAEGMLLGAAAGLGFRMASRSDGSRSLSRRLIWATLLGGIAGMLIPLLGGRMMGGSLDLLAQGFPNSRLHLAQIGAIFGEAGFGVVTEVVTGFAEGALFSGGVVGAMVYRRTRRS